MGGTYSCVEVDQVDAVGAKLLETRLEGLDDLVVLVEARLAGVLDLGREGQAPLLPLGLLGEGLLRLADVDARRVDLVVAARLEDVEHLAELVDVGDAGTVGFFGSEGHETQDNPVCGGCGDERHGGQFLLGGVE